MTQLLTGLVPLDTLAGWPEAPDPTPLQTLGLLVGVPALVFVVVFAIGKLSALAGANRPRDPLVTDALWLNASGRQSAEAREEAALESGAEAGKESGGASARW